MSHLTSHAPVPIPLSMSSGTGCIFHYDDEFPEGSGKGFKESDKPNFTGSYYSFTKVGLFRVPLFRKLHAAAIKWCRRRVCRGGFLWETAGAGGSGPDKVGAQATSAGGEAFGLAELTQRPSLLAQAATESFIKEFPNVLTLRVRMPIVESLTYPRNFITKVRCARLAAAQPLCMLCIDIM